jgi:hypothetical protein
MSSGWIASPPIASSNGSSALNNSLVMSLIAAGINLERHPGCSGGGGSIEQVLDCGDHFVGVSLDGRAERTNHGLETQFSYRFDSGDDMGTRIADLKRFDQEFSAANSHGSPPSGRLYENRGFGGLTRFDKK